MTQLEIFFGIATIIGTVLAIWQTAKAKSQEKELERYKYLFDIADKGIDKDKTIEELNTLKTEKKKMDEVISELPKRAHMAVLSDQYRDDEKNVVTYYERYMETKKAYEQLVDEVSTAIPDSILKEIEDQIMPKYLIKEKRDNYLRQIAILAYASSFISVFPYYHTLLISRLFLIGTAFPLFNIWRISIPKNPDMRRVYFIKWSFYGCFLISIVSVLPFTIILALEDVYYFSFDPDIIILLMLLASVFTVLAIVLAIIAKRSKLYPAEWTPIFLGFPVKRTGFLG